MGLILDYMSSHPQTLRMKFLWAASANRQAHLHCNTSILSIWRNLSANCEPLEIQDFPPFSLDFRSNASLVAYLDEVI